jgi:hypothetical protein
VIWIFIGYSGARAISPPRFPDGHDPDSRPRQCAAQLRDALRYLYPGRAIKVAAAWSRAHVFERLLNERDSIDQVHVIAQGDAHRLDLAYRYDDGRRLLERARRVARGATSPERRAEVALRDEDALVSGWLSNAASREQLAALRAHHRTGACWQLWTAPEPLRTLPDRHYLELAAYSRALSAAASPDGLAAEIARQLAVPCTTGLEALRTPNRQREGEWTWGAPAGWHTFWPNGARSSETVLLCGLPHPARAMAGERRPMWIASLARAARGLPRPTEHTSAR